MLTSNILRNAFTIKLKTTGKKLVFKHSTYLGT